MKRLEELVKLEEGAMNTMRNEEKASNRITRALRALEVGCYIVAIQACDLCLSEAEVIEQRLCALHLKSLALTGDAEYIKEQLRIAYDI